MNNEINWLAICDCDQCDRVSREWVRKYRGPASDFLTSEYGLAWVAKMMNHHRDQFEDLIRDMIASVVVRN